MWCILQGICSLCSARLVWWPNRDVPGSLPSRYASSWLGQSCRRQVALSLTRALVLKFRMHCRGASGWGWHAPWTWFRVAEP